MADCEADQLLQAVALAAEVQRQGEDAVQQVEYRVPHKAVFSVKPLHKYFKQFLTDFLRTPLHCGYHDKF